MGGEACFPTRSWVNRASLRWRMSSGINGEGKEGGKFEERLREGKTSPGYPIGQHSKHWGVAEGTEGSIKGP